MRFLLPFGLLASLLLAACGSKVWDDPKNTYDELVKAANEGKLGVIYDRMDTARRHEFERTVSAQMEHLDLLAPADRAHWEGLKGKSMRDVFAAVVGGDPAFSSSLKGRYAIARIDTFVVLTVKPEGADTSLVYLRRENDSMKLSGPPARPLPPPRPVPVQQPAPGEPRKDSVSKKKRG